MCADDQVVEAAERRLVVPEIAVGNFAVQHLERRRQVIVLVGPKQMNVGETEAGQECDGDKHHRSSAEFLNAGSLDARIGSFHSPRMIGHGGN